MLKAKYLFSDSDSFDFKYQKATFGSAAIDLPSTVDTKIWPFCKKKISTGISVEIPFGYCMLILPRSGLSTKEDLVLANQVGLIDSDYRGEVFVVLRNLGFKIRKIQRKQRIAQAVLIAQKTPSELSFVSSLSSTARGSGGFGHSGKT